MLFSCSAPVFLSSWALVDFSQMPLSLLVSLHNLDICVVFAHCSNSNPFFCILSGRQVDFVRSARRHLECVGARLGHERVRKVFELSPRIFDSSLPAVFYFYFKSWCSLHNTKHVDFPVSCLILFDRLPAIETRSSYLYQYRLDTVCNVFQIRAGMWRATRGTTAFSHRTRWTRSSRHTVTMCSPRRSSSCLSAPRMARTRHVERSNQPHTHKIQFVSRISDSFASFDEQIQRKNSGLTPTYFRALLLTINLRIPNSYSNPRRTCCPTRTTGRATSRRCSLSLALRTLRTRARARPRCSGTRAMC